MRGTEDSNSRSSDPRPRNPLRARWFWAYPAALLVVFILWSVWMVMTKSWGLFQTNWPMSVTMGFGSFIAGSTPAGGGAVAFPVFTKLLEVPSPVARTFSLMIQAVGMTMAGLFILTRGIPIAWGVVRWMLPGGIVGITISFYAPDMAEELPRLIFTMVALVFGIALVISHWALGWRPQLGGDDRIAGKRNHFHLVLVGVLGGYISGLVGSGVDLLGFIALTLAYGFHERLAVPTTVVIMAALSVVGTALFGFAGHETVGLAYPYWLVCAPVVAVGAPFGAWAVSKAPRELVVYFVLFLILLEAVSTTILLGWSGSTGLFALGVGVVTAIYFLAMIRYRNLTRTNGAA